MSADLIVGVEIDHTTVTAVAVQDGAVAWTRTATAESTVDALREVLTDTRPHDLLRVAVPGYSTTTAPLRLASEVRDHAALAEAVADATGASFGGAAAAVLPSPRPGHGYVGDGLAVTMPLDVIAAVYDMLPRRQCKVFATVAAASAVDGLSLALRWSGSELVLSRDGRAVAQRQLRAGSLADVEARLGSSQNGARPRVLDALDGRSVDPIAAGAVDKYLRRTVREVDDVLEEWARAGERIDRHVTVLGAGAHASALPALLRQASLSAPPSAPYRTALAGVAARDHGASATAYLAATLDERLLPAAAFVDPRALASARITARARVRRRRAVAVTLCLLPPLLGLAGPPLLGVVAEARASAQVEAVTLEVAGPRAKPAAADALKREVARRVLASSRTWTQALPLLTNMPPKLTLERIQAHPGSGRTVVVTGHGAATPAEVSDAARTYAHQLTLAPAVRAATVSRLTDAGGTVEFSVLVELKERS